MSNAPVAMNWSKKWLTSTELMSTSTWICLSCGWIS